MAQGLSHLPKKAIPPNTFWKQEYVLQQDPTYMQIFRALCLDYCNGVWLFANPLIFDLLIDVEERNRWSELPDRFIGFKNLVTKE